MIKVRDAYLAFAYALVVGAVVAVSSALMGLRQ